MADLEPVCISVAGTTVEQLLDRARRSSLISRFLELRLDYLREPQRSSEVVQALRGLRVACIATLRSAAAGGHFGGSAEEQLHILQNSARAGAEIVDLEIEAAEHLGLQAVRSLRRSCRLLLSFHDYRETPQNPASALQRLKSFPADYYKLVTWAHRHRDNAAVLDLLRQGRRRLVAFTLGETGRPTRLLCLAAGAPFTYAAASEAEVVGPGQMPAAQMCGCYRAQQISSRTQIYGVVGNPIEHSISPEVHNAAFAALDLDAVYLPFRVEEFEDFLAARKAYRLSGFSITLPHKEVAADAADRLDPIASRVGAVNTVVARRGRWHGYNTDVAGVLRPLEKRRKLQGARVLIAGAGGVARAAAFALADAGSRVVLVSRRPEQAAALAEEVGGETGPREHLSRERFDVIINATPLGMAPEVKGCFFSAAELNAPLVFETVYNPMETRLVRMARRRRLQVVLGLEMFLEQAAEQFELWTGKQAPRAVMEQAGRSALLS